MRTQIFNTFKITALAISLSFGISYVYAWTAPSFAPTGGNVSAPINTSGVAQSKAGSLGIGMTTTPTGMLQIGTLTSGLNGNINGASNPTRLIVNGVADSEAALTLGYYSAGYGLNLWVPANPSAPWPTYIDNINRYSGFRFRNNTSATPVDLMTIDATGNVGIGTATPSQTLTVAGAIGATGDICALGGAKCLSTLSTVAPAYSLQVLPGTSTHLYQTACRMNTLNGATTCFLSYQAVTPSWISTPSPFSATTNGSYALVCSAGSPSYNYPICCRLNNITGTTECKITQNVGGSWVASTNPF